MGMSKTNGLVNDVRSADMLCFSHLRWDFVFQRPQHLMSRFAKFRRVFFIEEPVLGDTPAINVRVCERTAVHIAVPVVPSDPGDRSHKVLESLIRDMMSRYLVTDFVAWYYTPMAVSFTSTLCPVATVYDCMDEFRYFGALPLPYSKTKRLLCRGPTWYSLAAQSVRSEMRTAPHVSMPSQAV